MTDLFTASYRTWSARCGQPVVASLTRPKWIDGIGDWPALWEATPRWSYFRAEGADAAYLAQLDRYGARRIAGRMAEIVRETGAERLCLLCWCGDPAVCHRSLWATWWLYTTGEVVGEVIAWQPLRPPGPALGQVRQDPAQRPALARAPQPLTEGGSTCARASSRRQPQQEPHWPPLA